MLSLCAKAHACIVKGTIPSNISGISWTMRCVAGGDRRHLQDKVEDGQTAGKQHMLERSSHYQQEDRPCGGSICAASETGGNTAHTLDRQDQGSSRDGG